MINEPENCKSIEDIRSEIDRIDYDLIQLIAQRSKYVKNAAKYKTTKNTVKAEDRVAAMIDQRRIWAKELDLSMDFVELQFRAMIQYFINQEMKEWECKN